MVSIKKKSKRQTTRLRAKIAKKARETRRKRRKEEKKKPSHQKLRRKDPGIPSSLPFKEAVLKNAEEWKRKKEEERQLAREKRKQERDKLKNKNRNLDSLVKDAEKKTAAFDKKTTQGGNGSIFTGGKSVETSLKTYYKEFKKVVDAADVILEVLDARDPLGSRCHEMEEAIISSGTDKRLVLVLNKIDLVPKENVEAWLKHLKNEFPVIAFKASTQTQNNHLCQTKMPLQKISKDLMKSSHCLGADVLMKLLNNYCRSKAVKAVIRVGVVGFPNTGKSSIINSLKRKKACSVGAMPGITKEMQEVHLDKHIKLLDSPGVVMATGNSDTMSVLRNCVRLEGLQDVFGPVEAILKRCNKEQILLHYKMPDFNDTNEFLSQLAKLHGRMLKGGIPDIRLAAKRVLQDWNTGKITYYTHPPEQATLPTHVSAEFVTQMGKEFDLDAIEADQMSIINNLVEKNSKHILVESLGQTRVAMGESEVKDVAMEPEVEDSGEEEEEEEEMLDDVEEEGDSEAENMEEEMEEDEKEDSEFKNTTVILPDSKKATKRPLKSSVKESAVDSGLPQSNRQRKLDFKKMKKDRRRRDRVAGALSDSMTSAFESLGGGDENYNFDDFF